MVDTKEKFTALFMCFFILLFPFLCSCDKGEIDFGFSFMDNVNKNLPTNTKLGNNFSIVFLDVGEGDCTFVHFPDGKNMLVDCGENDFDEKNLSLLKSVLSAYEVEIIDYLILTQPESKNIGNAKYVINNYNVGKAYIPKIVYLNSFPIFSAVSSLLIENQVETIYSYENTYIKGSDYGIAFLAPQQSGDDYATVNAKENPKNSEVDAISPIIYIEYNGVRFLVGGDQRIEQEQYVVETYESSFSKMFFANVGITFNLEDIDFYKASKNGDSSANGSTLLGLIKPKNVIISCGSDNYYGHPSSLCISNILKVNENASIYTTNVVGSVFALIDKNGEITIKTQSEINN